MDTAFHNLQTQQGGLAGQDLENQAHKNVDTRDEAIAWLEDNACQMCQPISITQTKGNRTHNFFTAGIEWENATFEELFGDSAEFLTDRTATDPIDTDSECRRI